MLPEPFATETGIVVTAEGKRPSMSAVLVSVVPLPSGETIMATVVADIAYRTVMV